MWCRVEKLVFYVVFCFTSYYIGELVLMFFIVHQFLIAYSPCLVLLLFGSYFFYLKKFWILYKSIHILFFFNCGVFRWFFYGVVVWFTSYHWYNFFIFVLWLLFFHLKKIWLLYVSFLYIQIVFKLLWLRLGLFYVFNSFGVINHIYRNIY